MPQQKEHLFISSCFFKKTWQGYPALFIYVACSTSWFLCFLVEAGKLIKPQPSWGGVGKPRISLEEIAGLPSFTSDYRKVVYDFYRKIIPSGGNLPSYWQFSLLLSFFLLSGQKKTQFQSFKRIIMQINGAIVKKQDVTFAIVTVKSFVMKNTAVADRIRANCSTIHDFRGVPIILAFQETRDQFKYQGRKDIVKYLADINPSRIPWARYIM